MRGFDYLKILATTSRADRWTKIGLIKDPDTVPADKPDKYGLLLDRATDAELSMLHEGGLGLAVATKSRRLMATHAISSACASP